MDKSSTSPATDVATVTSGEQTIRIVLETGATSGRRKWLTVLLVIGLGFSLLINFALLASSAGDFAATAGLREVHHSGDKNATEKIAIISISGTIMPPFTAAILEQIKQAREDDDVVGLVLEVDSPGGLVADSHQIYHELTLLAEKKPIFVQMKRIAASGGYYVAMGGGKNGKIFAEPTTWTGSIGVIIPHYDVTELADKVGVKSAPLKTGEFKDALSMFKPLSEREETIWDGILDDAYQRFVDVIESGRPDLTREQILATATGRVFTADQALEEGLIDEIGFLPNTIEQLKSQVNVESANVVRYQSPPTILDLVLGSMQGPDELSLLKRLVESPSPEAFYLLGLPQHDLLWHRE